MDDTLTALDFLHARGDVRAPWTTLWGSSAGVVAVAGSLANCSIGTPFDNPTGSDPVLMVVHGTNDPTVPYCEAVALKNWATSAGLPLDFQAVTDAGHVPSLHNHNAIHCCSPDIGQLPGKMPQGFR